MTAIVSALFVETNGAYFDRPGVDPWDIERDARTYDGPHSVVAHPPCHLWVNLAAVNWKRYQRERPAWYDGGTDYGCFASALASARKWGGVIEHPAFSNAWDAHGLTKPVVASVEDGGWDGIGWLRCARREWTCEVWQSAYGHRARKRTWLYVVSASRPMELRWERVGGSHQVGWFDRIKPTLSKSEASATPAAFRDALIALARGAR